MSTFDSQNWAQAFGVTTLTTNTFTIAANSNRASAVLVAHLTNTATGITASCSGVSGALILGTDSTTAKAFRTFIFGVTAPTAGASKTATCSWTGSRECEVGCGNFYNVDQTTPFTNGTFASGAAATAITPTGSGSDISIATAQTSGSLVPTQTLMNGPSAGTTNDWDSTRGAAGATHGWGNPATNWVASACNVLTASAGGSFNPGWATGATKIIGGAF